MTSIAPGSLRRWALAAAAFATCIRPDPVGADPVSALRPFTAAYDVRANGLVVGAVTVSLARQGDTDYLLRQESTGGRLIGLFDPHPKIETSRFRLADGGLEPLEYRSQREGGDDDDNAWLVFDWKEERVRNRGAGPHWEAPLSAGVIDPVLMSLAIMLDLRDGRHPLRYRVPHQGRIKTYAFERRGEEEIRLDSGEVRTLKIERTDDKRDRTSIWSAPELGDFAVRILKQRKWAIDTDVRLRTLDFAPEAPAARSEPTDDH